MRKLSAILSLCLVVAQGANAATVSDAAYANMQRAMGGIISQVSTARGFNASDPRIYNTMYGMGSAATAAVATAGAGLLIGGTAPAWGTVLAVAAISGGISYAVSVGADALYKWIFGAPAATPITIQSPLTSNAGTINIYTSATMPNMNTMVANSINQPWTYITSTPPNYYTATIYSTTAYTNPGAGVYTLWQNWTYNGVYYYVWTTPTTSSTSPCPSGYTYVSGSCQNQLTYMTTTLQTLTQAINNLSANEQAQAVSNQAMAVMLNYLWQSAAAQPNYAGLPYNASMPIQASDVAAWQSANSGAYPAVSALVASVPSGSNGFVPSTTTTPGVAVAPAVSPNSPGATTPGGSTPEINLGSDPGIPAPTLESTPTASMILAPITGLMPSLMNYQMPAHTGTCPQPSVTLWGQTYTMTSHCTLAEQNRTVFQGMFLAAFVIAALFIVLTA